MSIDLAALASIVSMVTALGSMAIASAAFRRSGPRSRVKPGDLAYRANSVSGGRLTVDVRVVNSGDRPVHIAGASLVALAPLERGRAPNRLSEPRPLSVLSIGGGRAKAAPLGPLRPTKLVARRSTRWQQFAAPLDVPKGETALTVNAFEGIEFTSPVWWSVAKKSHWLRLEVALTTGVVLVSPWWRNSPDVIEIYEALAVNDRSLSGSARGLQRGLRARLRRVRNEDTDQR